MNPYLVGFGVGTGVGLWYERDLDRAASRAGIVTFISYAVQTPQGKAVATTSLASAARFSLDVGKSVVIAGSYFTGSVSGAALGTAATYTLAAGAGAVIGAATGTAISSVAFGQEGKQKAIQFYTGQANLMDYIPHYNAYKIVRHYVKEAIEA